MFCQIQLILQYLVFCSSVFLQAEIIRKIQKQAQAGEVQQPQPVAAAKPGKTV